MNFSVSQSGLKASGSALGRSHQVGLARTSKPLSRAQVSRPRAGPEAGSTSKSVPPSINVISPISQWPEGIPPAMGGHLMHSGGIAPPSQSKGAGVGVAPLVFSYPSGDLDIAVEIYDDRDAVAVALAEEIAKASAAAIASKDSYTIALSGGSLPQSLSLLRSRDDVDFSKWYVLFADERVVPHDDGDSNLRLAREAVLDGLPGLDPSRVLALAVDASGRPLAPDAAATQYAGQILSLPEAFPLSRDGLPTIDDILLGVGPDGHVASLFPNSPLLKPTRDVMLAVLDSPKPPPERITLSLQVINAAKRVIVVAIGAGKAEIVQRVLEVQSLPGALPAQLVRPASGALAWFLDTESAAHLRVPDWATKGRKSPFPRSDIR